MRPVSKPQPGAKIIIHQGSDIMCTHVIQSEYHPHRRALHPLVAALGRYCSYCECHFGCENDLDVEHIRPKTLNAALASSWSNFLLSCRTCNGPANKHHKSVDPDEIHLPHINNTFKSLVYKEAGVVQINGALTPLGKSRAARLHDLLGFGKKDELSDMRRNSRRRIWQKAKDTLHDYTNGNHSLKSLMDVIVESGYWSIWFTVFEGHDEVRKAMIEEFHGTASECFDATDGYRPIDRNPGNLSDPT